MKESDDFSSSHEAAIEGRYDGVDRIILHGYFTRGHHGGGFRQWWCALHGSDANLDQAHRMQMAGKFSRRVHADAKAEGLPLFPGASDERQHELAAQHRPQDPHFTGLFLILVAKAPALGWEVTRGQSNCPHLETKKPWPYVNHHSNAPNIRPVAISGVGISGVAQLLGPPSRCRHRRRSGRR